MRAAVVIGLQVTEHGCTVLYHAQTNMYYENITILKQIHAHASAHACNMCII